VCVCVCVCVCVFVQVFGLCVSVNMCKCACVLCICEFIHPVPGESQRPPDYLPWPGRVMSFHSNPADY
jgi:hypothetical protein